MRSFYFTSLFTNIPIIDTLSAIKDHANNNYQFITQTAIPQYKFLDLVNLVLTTTWYTFNFMFYQQIDGVTLGGPASSTTSEIYMQAHEQIATQRHCTLQKVGKNLLMTFILKGTHLENFFHDISNIHQNIYFTFVKKVMEK